MKFILRSVVLSAFAMFVSVFSANAQSGHVLEARIPFEFIAGQKIFEPGNYKISIIPSTSGGAFVKISRIDSDEAEGIFATTVGATTEGTAGFVFETVNGQKYLAKV